MNQEQKIFIDSVGKFLDREINPHVDGWEAKGRFPDSVFKTLGDAGYLGLLIPEDQGGIGGDYLLAGKWCEKFGEVRSTGLVTGVNMHMLVIAPALAKYGSSASKAQFLQASIEGTKIGAYAFTEPGAGSDLMSIRTTATKIQNGYRINGAKTFITNGARADYILLLTKTDTTAGYKGFTTFVIDTKLPGFSVNRTLPKLGWHASDTAELTLDDMILPDSAVLGKVGEGWKQAARNLNWERLMLALTSLGGARACYLECYQYCENRPAFGKKIIDIPVVKEILAEMRSKILHGDYLCQHALQKLNRDEPCEKEVAFAKVQLCEDAIWIADRAIQLHGGYGYVEEYPSARWWRDLRLMTIGGGTTEIIRNVGAKALGLSIEK